MKRIIGLCSIFAALLFSIIMPQYSWAVTYTYTWTGSGNNDNWTTVANWSAALTEGADPDFSYLKFAGAARLTPINDYSAGSGGFNTSRIDFLSGAGAFTLTGDGSGDSLDMLGADGKGNLADFESVNNFSTATQTINLGLISRKDYMAGIEFNTAAGDIVVGGLISEFSGTGAQLRKTGNYTLTLNGSVANTYTGATTINSGTLILDFVSRGANPVNLVNSSSALILGGGILKIKGRTGANTTSQTLGGLTLNTGGGQILINPNSGTSSLLTLNSINATALGSSLLAGTALGAGVGVATITTSTAKDASGIYGGRIVFTSDGGTTDDWATTMSGGAPYTLSAYSSYETSEGNWINQTTTKNVSLIAAPTTMDDTTMNSLKLGGAAAYSVAINAGKTLTIASGGLLLSGSAAPNISGGTIQGASGVDLIVHQYSSDLGTISSIIADNTSATGLTKTGPGTLVLANNANTYTGKTYINGGILQIANADTALGTAPAAAVADQLNINGGTLQFSGNTALVANRGVTLNAGGGIFDTQGNNPTINGIITGVGALTKTSSGQLTLGGVNTFTGPTIINGGTVSIGADSRLGTVPGSATSGNIVLNGGTLKVTAGFTVNANRGITLNAGGGTLDNGGNSLTTYLGIIEGGGALSLTGSGQWVFGGASTYSGGTTLNNTAGEVVLKNSSTGTAGNPTTGPFGSGTAPLILNGAQIRPTATAAPTYTIGNTVTLAADTTFTTAASEQNLELSGPVTLTGNRTLTVNIGATVSTKAVTITGAIGEDQAGRGLTKGGTGNLILSGANNYTGLTTLNSGTLTLGAANTLNNSSGIIVTGGTLDMTTYNQSVNAVKLTGGTITSTSGSLTSATDFDMQNGTVSAILNGVVGLNKTTASTVTLSGVNTYTGLTTINNGTLTLGTANALASGTGVLVNGGNLSFTTFNQSVNSAKLTSGTITSTSGLLTSATDFDVQSGTVSAILDGNVSLIKNTAGTVTLSSVNTYTGLTVINGGTLTLNFANLSIPSDVIKNGNAMAFAGGTLNILGKSGGTSSQTFNSTTLSSGASTCVISRNGASGSATLNLGVVTHNTGTTLNFQPNTAWSITPSGTESVNVASGGSITVPSSGAQYFGAWAFQGTGSSTAYLQVNSTGQIVGAPAATLAGATGSGSTGSNMTDANTVYTTTGIAGITLNANRTGYALIANTSGNYNFALGSYTVTLNGYLSTGAGKWTFTQNGGGTVKIGVENEFVINTVTADVEFAAPIVNGNTGTSKVSIGGTRTNTFSGANTYSGATAMNGGTLLLKHQNALQNSTLTMNGGTAALVFDSSVSGHAFNFGGLAAASAGTGYDIALKDNAATPNAIALTVGGNNSNTTYAGVLSDIGSLIKIGNGTLMLSGANTYSGGTLVSNGTLAVGADNVVGTGVLNLSLSGSATLTSDGSATRTVTNAMTISGYDNNYFGQTSVGTGNLILTGPINNGMAAPKIWTVNNSTTMVNGVISGTQDLTKAGPGVLVLAGANSLSGNITNSAGTLLVNGSTTAGSTVIVQNGGTLGGTGIISGAVTVKSGGILAPGNSVGTNTVGSLSLESGATFAVEVSGSGTDQTISSNAVSLGGATLTVSRLSDATFGSAYIVSNLTGGVSGQFVGLSEGAPVFTNSNGTTIYYIHYRSSYVELNQSATPVVLLQLQALTLGGKVTVRWSTSSESKTAGFDLYRVVNGQSVKLNDTLIAAKGWSNGGIGASYSVADSTAQPGQTYTYKLVERTTDGQSIDYGPYDRTVSEFMMKPLEVTAAGAKVRWLSRAGENYRVLKSTDLTTGQYQPIAENLAATPPENEYLDAAPGNSGFYRIELQP